MMQNHEQTQHLPNNLLTTRGLNVSLLIQKKKKIISLDYI